MYLNYVAMKLSKPVLRKQTHLPMAALPDLVSDHPQAPFAKHLKPGTQVRREVLLNFIPKQEGEEEQHIDVVDPRDAEGHLSGI